VQLLPMPSCNCYARRSHPNSQTASNTRSATLSNSPNCERHEGGQELDCRRAPAETMTDHREKTIGGLQSANLGEGVLIPGVQFRSKAFRATAS
jgi:hypothetical protein